jgi:hypothetical protein
MPFWSKSLTVVIFRSVTVPSLTVPKKFKSILTGVEVKIFVQNRTTEAAFSVETMGYFHWRMSLALVSV